MTDTKEILAKIAALRLRLDHAQHHVAPRAAGGEEQPEENTLPDLRQKIAGGAWDGRLLDDALRRIESSDGAGTQLPTKLTARSARVLKRGREMLHELRAMLEDPLLHADEDDPLTGLHVETSAMLDVLLRTLGALPPSPSAQIRLCEGLEATLGVIEERLLALNAALTHHRRELGRVDALAEIFGKLAAGQAINPRDLLTLAEEISREARAGEPLRFLHAAGEQPARFVAAHSITVARVLGHVLRADPEWKDRLDEALLAALLHDVGMVRVPGEILAQPGPLTLDQRRLVERHPGVGAQMVSSIMPGGGIFVEGAADHHERMDGTGYPAGRRDAQISPFVRVLAICDTYAALAAPRPYRPAKDTRTALTDTLLSADQGAFDRAQAEKLMSLSFYPVGSVVELNDGAAGYVIAPLPGRSNMEHPDKALVSLFTGAGGQVLALPRIVDLQADGRSIVRGLPARERRKLLLGRYPELV